MNTPQLKGTATKFMEVYNYADGVRSCANIKLPISLLDHSLRVSHDKNCKTIAVWHITPHPFIDINQFKTN